jgi:hypothetical protein
LNASPKEGGVQFISAIYIINLIFDKGKRDRGLIIFRRESRLMLWAWVDSLAFSAEECPPASVWEVVYG